MMSEISKEYGYISEIIGRIAIENNLSDWLYTEEKFESIAQNYFGVIVPVVLSGMHEGEEVKIPLVLKLAPTDERYRVSGAVTAMFAREVFVYSVVLKAYRELQEHFLADSLFVTPRCYFVQSEHCKEVIVMQDMHAIGYKPYVHLMFLDLDHISISLKSLAKLHALSFILRDQHPELYAEISEVCIPLKEQTNKRYMDIMKDRLGKAIDKFNNTEYKPLLEALRHRCREFFESAVHSVKQTCLCHGDIWKENILFKYEDNKPVSSCLIDYQTSRICSPAFDALYLILSSTNTDLRQKHYQRLLDVYYQTFDQTLCEGGLNSQKIYSRPMLDFDLRVVGPACFITANTALWLSNGLQQEGHVRSKQIWSTCEEKEAAVTKYKAIIKAMIDDLNSYGYLKYLSDHDNH